MSKIFKCLITFLGCSCFIIVSLLYAEQYHTACRNTILLHAFDVVKICMDFITNIIKEFNWSFLVLLLFLIPSIRIDIHTLVREIGDKLVSYGKALNNRIDPVVENQNKNDKKEFEKEKQEQECLNNNTHPRIETSIQTRQKLYEKVQKQLVEKMGTNIEDFKSNTKLMFDNDPVLSSGALMFDCSYRYKGNRMRRYINTLIVYNTSLLIRSDNIYKYIRIMNDINNSRKNQRYAVEIIVLNTVSNKTQNSYEILKERYAEALDLGILALKECIVENGKISLLHKTGWILD